MDNIPNTNELPLQTLTFETFNDNEAKLAYRLYRKKGKSPPELQKKVLRIMPIEQATKINMPENKEKQSIFSRFTEKVAKITSSESAVRLAFKGLIDVMGGTDMFKKMIGQTIYTLFFSKIPALFEHLERFAPNDECPPTILIQKHKDGIYFHVYRMELVCNEENEDYYVVHDEIPFSTALNTLFVQDVVSGTPRPISMHETNKLILDTVMNAIDEHLNTQL